MENKLKEIKTKIKVLFSQALTEDEMKLLKDSLVKLEGEVAAAGAPPATPTVVKSKDGVNTFSYTGTLGIGIDINMVAADGSLAPAPDGTYILEDGNSITVMSGKVSEVSTAQEEGQDATEMAQLKAQFSTQKTELEAMVTKFSSEKSELVKEITELKKVQLATLQTLDKILNVPVETIDLESKGKSYEDMSPAEKYRHDHPIN